jgi:hypothetical protein
MKKLELVQSLLVEARVVVVARQNAAVVEGNRLRLSKLMFIPRDHSHRPLLRHSQKKGVLVGEHLLVPVCVALLAPAEVVDKAEVSGNPASIDTLKCT